MKGFIKALRASAATRGVPLPLVVRIQPGSHYGDSQLARAEIEHKFPLLLVLVPETMLKRTPGLRERLNINESATSSHSIYTILRIDQRGFEGQKVGTTVAPQRMSRPPTAREQRPCYRCWHRKIDFFKMLVPRNRFVRKQELEFSMCMRCLGAPRSSRYASRGAFSKDICSAILERKDQGDAAEGRKGQYHCTVCERTVFFEHQRRKTSSSPPSLQVMLVVRAGAREVVFLVSMICHNLAHWQLRVISHGGTGINRGSASCPKYPRFVSFHGRACLMS